MKTRTTSMLVWLAALAFLVGCQGVDPSHESSTSLSETQALRHGDGYTVSVSDLGVEGSHLDLEEAILVNEGGGNDPVEMKQAYGYLEKGEPVRYVLGGNQPINLIDIGVCKNPNFNGTVQAKVYLSILGQSIPVLHATVDLPNQGCLAMSPANGVPLASPWTTRVRVDVRKKPIGQPTGNHQAFEGSSMFKRFTTSQVSISGYATLHGGEVRNIPPVCVGNCEPPEPEITIIPTSLCAAYGMKYANSALIHPEIDTVLDESKPTNTSGNPISINSKGLPIVTVSAFNPPNDPNPCGAAVVYPNKGSNDGVTVWLPEAPTDGYGYDRFINANFEGIWTANREIVPGVQDPVQIVAVATTQDPLLGADVIFGAEHSMFDDSTMFVPKNEDINPADGVGEFYHLNVNGPTVFSAQNRIQQAVDVDVLKAIDGPDPLTGLIEDDVMFAANIGDAGGAVDIESPFSRVIGFQYFRKDINDNVTPNNPAPFVLTQITKSLFKRYNTQTGLHEDFEKSYCEYYCTFNPAAPGTAPIDAESIRFYPDSIAAIDGYPGVPVVTVGQDPNFTGFSLGHQSQGLGDFPNNPNGLESDRYGSIFVQDPNNHNAAIGRDEYRELADPDTLLPGFNACVGNGTATYLAKDIIVIENDTMEEIDNRFSYGWSQAEKDIFESLAFRKMVIMNRIAPYSKCAWGLMDDGTFVQLADNTTTTSELASAASLSMKSQGATHTWVAKISDLTVDETAPTLNQVTQWNKAQPFSEPQEFGHLQYPDFQVRPWDVVFRLFLRSYFPDGSPDAIVIGKGSICNNETGGMCSAIEAGDQTIAIE